VQLAVDVAPLAHAQRREEIFVAGLHQLALRLLVLDSPSYQCQSLSQERNSDFSSANFLCAASAVPCRSCGRSRGSCTVSAAAMTSTSFRQPSSRAATIMRADARVERHLRQFLADGVSACSSVTAPSSSSSW
jgi:hypothetical protein